MGNLEKRTQEVVFQTCLLLIKHFRNLIEFQNETNQSRLGYNSRVFELAQRGFFCVFRRVRKSCYCYISMSSRACSSLLLYD